MDLRVNFLFYGNLYDGIAKVMIASVRKHMPNAIITQLSDTRTKKVEGVDEIRRLEGRLYHYLLWKHLDSCPLPYIKLDYDMVLQGDLTHILESEQDYAFNLHGDEKVENTEYGRLNPVAASVWGAKKHGFAKRIREIHNDSGEDDWLGLVHSMNDACKEFPIRYLPGHIYNYAPASIDDKPDSALVLHYKGKRKRWMVPENEVRAIMDENRIVALCETYSNPQFKVLSK